jgi:hypothetical protein
MHRIRPYIRLIEGVLVGAGLGIGNALLWWFILGQSLPVWAVGLIALPSALLLMGLAVGAQQGLADRRQPRRRAHARPATSTRKAA